MKCKVKIPRSKLYKMVFKHYPQGVIDDMLVPIKIAYRRAGLDPHLVEKDAEDCEIERTIQRLVDVGYITKMDADIILDVIDEIMQYILLILEKVATTGELRMIDQVITFKLADLYTLLKLDSVMHICL